MRREGYEFQVSRPEVITKEVNGRKCEPVEHLVIDTVEDHVIDTVEDHVGFLTESLGRRLAEMVNLHNDGSGNVRLEYTIPTRGLIGFRNLFLTATRGNGIMGSIFLGYEPWCGAATRAGRRAAGPAPPAPGRRSSLAAAIPRTRAVGLSEPSTILILLVNGAGENRGQAAAGRRAKADVLVLANGVSSSQATKRVTLSATAVRTCWRCVLMRPR